MSGLKTLAVATIVSLLIAACGSADSGPSTTLAPTSTTTTPETGPAPSNYAGYLRQPTACGAEQPTPAVDMSFEAPEDVGLSGPTTLTLATSCGPIVIELSPDTAPETANSFVFLAESGYFDGTVSHRILPGFMMQAGDPTATGFGGPGYVLPDELPSQGATYSLGTVAMANAGPGTTGSQFFIMFDDADWLPANYTIVGRVTSGLDTLERIAALPLAFGPGSADQNPSTPLESVYIESITIER